jgi:hypothetical protein
MDELVHYRNGGSGSIVVGRIPFVAQCGGRTPGSDNQPQRRQRPTGYKAKKNPIASHARDPKEPILVAIPNSVAASQSARKDEETKDRQRDALRQAIFEKASNDALGIPNGYLKVAVKIIRWDESIDDLSAGHTSEVSINPTSSLATCDHVPNLVYRLSG